MSLVATINQRSTLRRQGRYEARRALRTITQLDRVRSCGARGVMPDGAAILKVSGSVEAGTRSAGFGGLASCGSVWACPWCSAKIAAHRQNELGTAISRWQAAGGGVAMLTLTMRHRKGQSLRSLWDALSYAWSKTTTGKGWEGRKSRFGVAGWVKVIEVTVGDNGWHIHVHAVLFLDEPSGPAPMTQLGQELFGLWADALDRKGFATPTEKWGVKCEAKSGPAAAVLGDYFTKNTYSADRLALEIARGDLKSGRRGNRTPFGILNGLVLTVQTGELPPGAGPDDTEIWLEWERSSKGRRMMTWSKGMRAALLYTVELDDQTIVDTDIGGEVVALIPASTLKALESAGRSCELWHYAERDNSGLLWQKWMVDNGFPYLLPPPPDPNVRDFNRSG